MNSAFNAGLFVLLCVTAAACTASVDTTHDNGAHSQPAGGTARGIGDPGAGHGGDQLRCPEIIGITGRAAAYVESFGLQCGGPSMDQRVMTERYGGGGGHEVGPVSCPDGYYAIGVFGNVSKYIDSIGLHCTDGITTTATSKMGGEQNSGGTPYDFQCPQDQKLIGFDVRDGEHIDYLGPICGARVGAELAPKPAR